MSLHGIFGRSRLEGELSLKDIVISINYGPASFPLMEIPEKKLDNSGKF